jgi:protein gp37
MALGADQPLELFRWPLPNVWLGVSCEDQARADERIPDLLATPAAVRFASAEPLLRPIDFTDISVDQGSGIEQWNALIAEPHDSPDTKLNWIIAGGESGPGARPMHPDWVRAIRDQCAAAGTAFHFKQWGEWAVTKPEPGGDLGGEMRRDLVRFVQRDREADGHFRKGDVIMKRVGKKRAGRLLDGIEHNRFPP